MGLDTTHDCWHGAYSAFHRWRSKLAEVAGLPPLELMAGFYKAGKLVPQFASIYADDADKAAAREAAAGRGAMPESVFRNHPALRALPISWALFATDPLTKLLNHSDCDGSIQASDCGPLADRLQELVPRLPEGTGGGHIGDWRAKTEAFIAGLRRAAAAGEDVEFH